MRIYIAGPYTADTEEETLDNVEVALGHGARVMMLGHDPFVPHLAHFLDLTLRHQCCTNYDHGRWMRWCLRWLETCDAVFRYARSPGADEEFAFALGHDLEVFLDLSDIPKATT